MTPGFRSRTILFAIALLAITPVERSAAQPTGQAAQTAEQLGAMVERFRLDDRGPFRAILWYCVDGTTRPAQSRCDQPGGIQHAAPKEEVVRLASESHIYLGQILAGTPNEAFLDEGQRHSRAKQYILERFLRNVDDGWIYRKAQFYRGAVQAEDEEAWSQGFLVWLLEQDAFISQHFLLTRDLVRALPRGEDQEALQRIRANAKLIADAYPSFSTLRVKIHGQPEAADRVAVRRFYDRNQSALTGEVAARFDSLLSDMDKEYGDLGNERLRQRTSRIPQANPVRVQMEAFVSGRSSMTPAQEISSLADILDSIRREVSSSGSARTRLALLDLSIELENQVLRVNGTWVARTIRDLMEKNLALARATAGLGYLEEWEWQSIAPRMRQISMSSTLTLSQLEERLLLARRVVEWGVSRVETLYGETVRRHAEFEPLAAGFTDDRLRSSVLLALGQTADVSGSIVSAVSGRENVVMGLDGASRIRGLNAGVARGALEVVSGSTEDIDFQSDRIYVLDRAPAELKPVAGIATVSEGNVVSHVQLLARNLGIPNAVVTTELLGALSAFQGESIFYAVSPRGAVRFKLEADMTQEERALVEERTRSDERIRVSIDRMDLTSTELTALFDLRASDSGRLCGPKAANLGQLSSLFPGRVAPGFIVPFSIFRSHMGQTMPGSSGTYWDFLVETFSAAAESRAGGTSESIVDRVVLERLATLRSGIESMPLQSAFVEAIRSRFQDIFQSSVGSTPVFIRSDTNMEDLKDFTGAGLNLTVPNVVSEQDILQAIRRVWASPYRERGYSWRQKYLLNPQDVYPSILVLKSVDVAKSGVMITTGIASGNPEDVTIAFNHGVGGAVDGQAAETYLLSASGREELLAPAREPTFRALPTTGGTALKYASFENSITTSQERAMLRDLASEVRRILPGTPGVDSAGPYDMELGFLDGSLWLFQVRPFVENRNAGAMQYLQEMDVVAQANRRVSLDAPLTQF